MNKFLDCINIRQFGICDFVIVAGIFNETRHTKDILLYNKNNLSLKNRSLKTYEKLSGLKII